MFSAVILMLAGSVTSLAGNMLGDADCDGKVTISDVTCIQMKIAELPIQSGFSEQAADIDGSGVIDITDATIIQQWLADIVTPYPIGEQIAAPTEPPTEKPTEKPTQRPTDADGWGRDIFRP